MPETLNVMWWATAVELPVIGSLFWLVLRLRQDAEQAIDDVRERAERAQTQGRDALAAFKLEVAKSYVSIATLKDVETRLTDHLLRIETKIECGKFCPVEGGGR